MTTLSQAPAADALRAELRRTSALAIGAARSGLFWLESLPLRGTRALGGLPAPEALPEDLARAAGRALRRLLEEDADRVARGVYPWSVLQPAAPRRHALDFLRVLGDSIGVARRASRGEARSFDEAARAELEGLPAYYRRNFHYQTNGYLSESSAMLYEHQVQILFRGAADAMRRLVVEPLKKTLGSETGRGLRLLELGAGCGSATRFVAAALPEAQIVALDLSAPYLREGRRRASGLRRVDWLRGDATDLDFVDDRFDAVFSVFLLHEMPGTARRAAIGEALRVTRPGGVIAVVDSVQERDAGALRWAIDRFPLSFHEPYFRDYARHPVETLFDEAGADSVETATGFVSKCVWGRVPPREA